MATKRAPRKRITRGKSVRLPNGSGSIIITRAGEILFKKAKKKAAARRKNPAKAKQPARRVLKAMATWVRSQAPAKKKRTSSRRTGSSRTSSRRTRSRKGGRR
jgi:hypothetical protein